MGHRAKDGLVLPRPMRRTIRLLYPDGKPLMGVPVPVSLYGSSSNHCGVAVGVKLAISTTDTHGEIHVVATNSPLALSMHHYEEKSEGPAGKAFVSVGDLTVGEPGNITVKKLWTLLEHDYAVRIKTSDDHPIPRARLKACMFLGGCGAGCGPVNAPESDSSGLIRFRAEDLRMMESLTAVDEHGSERQLTHSEMRELLTTYRLELAWE